MTSVTSGSTASRQIVLSYSRKIYSQFQMSLTKKGMRFKIRELATLWDAKSEPASLPMWGCWFRALVGQFSCQGLPLS